MNITIWEVAVLRYSCGCESHWRKRKGSRSEWHYHDCAVKCRPGDECKGREANYEMERVAINRSEA